MNAANLLSCITFVSLGDGSCKGTTHAFILHWLDQVRNHYSDGAKKTTIFLNFANVKQLVAQFKTQINWGFVKYSRS